MTEEDVEKPRPKPKSKKKAPVQEVTEGSDVEDEEPQTGPSKPKGKAKSTVPQESVSNAPKKRGRPKITADEEDEPPKKRSTTKKAAGRPSATSQRRDEEDEAEEEAKVKKKRKLKIFNSSQPSTFTLTFDANKVCSGCSSSSRPFRRVDWKLVDERAGHSDRVEPYERGRSYDPQVNIFFEDKFFVYQITPLTLGLTLLSI